VRLSALNPSLLLIETLFWFGCGIQKSGNIAQDIVNGINSNASLRPNLPRSTQCIHVCRYTRSTYDKEEFQTTLFKPLLRLNLSLYEVLNPHKPPPCIPLRCEVSTIITGRRGIFNPLSKKRGSLCHKNTSITISSPSLSPNFSLKK
jgi:hypothetical protein